MLYITLLLKTKLYGPKDCWIDCNELSIGELIFSWFNPFRLKFKYATFFVRNWEFWNKKCEGMTLSWKIKISFSKLFAEKMWSYDREIWFFKCRTSSLNFKIFSEIKSKSNFPEISEMCSIWFCREVRVVEGFALRLEFSKSS
jgi:hypothetical protein